MLIFGSQFNEDLLTLAGLNPALYDLSTVEVDTFNTAGPTTLRVTMLTTVDSTGFANLIQQYLTAAETAVAATEQGATT